MHSKAFRLLVLLLATLCLASGATKICRGAGAQGLQNEFSREPFLLLSFQGQTVLGPVQTLLVVYGDGHFSYSTISDPFILEGVVVTDVLPGQVVERLARRLSAAGAHQLRDAIDPTSSQPVSTVTFMRPVTKAAAHTYSYNFYSPGHAVVQGILSDFLSRWILPNEDSGGAPLPSAPLEGASELRREPICMYDASGPSLGRAAHTSIVVYNDGFVSVAKVLDSSSAKPKITVKGAVVSSESVAILTQDLTAAGAGSIGDSRLPGQDLPLHTFTYFRGDTNATSNSFSFFVPSLDHSQVVGTLESFVLTNLPVSMQ